MRVIIPTAAVGGAALPAIMAQGLGNEDRQAPRAEKSNRGASAPAGRDYAPHLG